MNNSRKTRRLPKSFAVLLGGLLLLGGCSTLPPESAAPVAVPPPVQAPEPPPAVVEPAQPEAVMLAVAMLDAPYRRGGVSPAGFDCSGLVFYVYRQLGVTLARSALDQFRQARPVPQQALQAGDLVFFRLGGKVVSHVGIYTGDGRFIHAPTHGKRVSYARLDDPFWDKRFAGAGRLDVPRS